MILRRNLTYKEFITMKNILEILKNIPINDLLLLIMVVWAEVNGLVLQ